MAKSSSVVAPAHDTPEVKTIPAPLKSDGKARIAFTLDKAGNIDADALRSKGRQVLKNAIADPVLATKLGASAGSAPDMAAQLVPICAMLVHVLGAIAAGVCEKRGYSNPQVMLYSREEQQAIAVQMVAVLNKYGANLRYAEEILLAISLVTPLVVKGMSLTKPATVDQFPRRVDAADGPQE